MGPITVRQVKTLKIIKFTTLKFNHLNIFSVRHHRPIWTVKARCPEQTLDLNPTDPEGDQIICRWASKDEASG